MDTALGGLTSRSAEPTSTEHETRLAGGAGGGAFRLELAVDSGLFLDSGREVKESLREQTSAPAPGMRG